MEALAIIGAITGVIGALTGVVSLGRQVVTHRRSGRLVNVNCSYSIPVDGPPVSSNSAMTIKWPSR